MNGTLLRLNIPNPANLPQARLDEEELRRLSIGENLSRRLREFDAATGGFGRLFIMGCGRSGTWLLARLVSTLEGQELIPRELPVEAFGVYATRAPGLVIKRSFKSYETVEKIPPSIRVLCIVRHPYDVLTSHNPVTKDRFHVPPRRWLGEMAALRYLVDSRRPETKIIRYEDLVASPEKTQQEIADFLGTRIALGIDRIGETQVFDEKTMMAMHGLRKIDAASVGKHRHDPAKIDYLKSIRPGLDVTLEWVAAEFGYDLAL